MSNIDLITQLNKRLNVLEESIVEMQDRHMQIQTDLSMVEEQIYELECRLDKFKEGRENG